MAHTPGPWTLQAGRHIATGSGSFSIHSNDDWNRNWPELDANAKVMAASPQLLAFALALLPIGATIDDLAHRYDVPADIIRGGFAALDIATDA